VDAQGMKSQHQRITEHLKARAAKTCHCHDCLWHYDMDAVREQMRIAAVQILQDMLLHSGIRDTEELQLERDTAFLNTFARRLERIS
jgi:hypothetical protein